MHLYQRSSRDICFFAKTIKQKTGINATYLLHRKRRKGASVAARCIVTKGFARTGGTRAWKGLPLLEATEGGHSLNLIA